MAWQTDVNILYTGSNARTVGMLWRLWKILQTAGWTPLGSGDGLAAFENDGDTAGPYDVLSVDPGLTSFPSGIANSMGNATAWWRAQSPGGGPLEVACRVNGTESGVIAIAPSGFVDTGVANADTPPTGATQQFLNGSTSWTNYVNVGSSVNEDRRIHVAASDSAIDGVYPFYCVQLVSTTSTVRGGWWFSSISDPSAGDPQAWISQAHGSDEAFVALNALTERVTQGPRAFYDYGGASESWDIYPALVYDDSSFGGPAAPRGLSAQADGDVRHFPVVFANQATGRYKGISTMFKWKGTTRDYPDTFELAGPEPRVIIGDLVLPWEQGTVPL